jgi:serine/threonine-protein kinase
MNHPTQLSKYAINQVIGEGAMGVVYKATDTVLRRTVAIKTLRRPLVEQGGSGALGGALLARFRNEAQAAARLMHHNIVAVHDYGEHEAEPYIVMEYVQGSTLKEPLRRGTRFDDADIVGLMGQLLDGLHYAHEQGVWHRDIKPANLLWTNDGRLKIVDFGIARIATMGLSQVSSTIGTPGHMAPEQYAGEQVDRRVDIFAAGVLLYMLLAGRPPFVGSNENVMFQTLSSEPLPPSRVHGSHRPQWFDPVVARAMAKRPDDRFATAMEFKHALMAQASHALGLPPIAARVEAGSSFIELQSAPTLPDPRASDWQRGTFALDTRPQPAAARPSQWHSETLQMLESELAQSIGPLARVLVQRAARSTGDLTSLRQTLAEQIDTEAGRDQFLQRTRSRASSFGTLGSGGAAVTTRRRAADDTLLGDQVMRVAELALTQHVGPVARVIVSRAAARASSRDEFFRLLAQHVEDEDEREELMRTLESSSAGR